MKIIQVNTWMGNLLFPLLRFIEEQDPDIVCTQEVFSTDIERALDTARYKVYGNVKELFEYGFYSPTQSFPAFEGKVEIGNAIFSKHKLENLQTMFVNGEYINLTKENFDYNVRNIQSCTVEINDKKLTIINHHGYHLLNAQGDETSLKCMEKVVSFVGKHDGPMLVCGDFNVSPSSKPLQMFEQGLDLRNLVVESGARTTLSDVFKVKNLEVVCDYIFASKDIDVKEFSVSNEIVSDHKALLLEFDF